MTVKSNVSKNIFIYFYCKHSSSTYDSFVYDSHLVTTPCDVIIIDTADILDVESSSTSNNVAKVSLRYSRLILIELNNRKLKIRLLQEKEKEKRGKQIDLFCSSQFKK
ncbi:hypothetical protein BLOT_010456 [Blomia tropicalis]|nr:hypothetical protein BLOT_010456 [Blomia tropicalis]